MPGDNVRVAATLKNLDLLTEDNIPPSAQTAGQKNDNEVALFVGDISPLLTVWRGLHLELDSMAAGRDEEFTNMLITNTGQETTPNHPGHSWAEFGNWDASQYANGQFEGGTITVAGGGQYTIVSSIGNRLFVNGDITPDVNKTAAFADDDVALVPRKVDITFATVRFKQAYIDVIEAPSESTLTIPFEENLLAETNLEIESVSEPGRTSAFLTSPQYWTIQLVSSYQPMKKIDFDPNRRFHFYALGFDPGDQTSGLGVTPAETYNGYNNECLIFLESTRDFADFSHLPYSGETPVTAVEIELGTVAHEIAHVFGCDEGMTGIMGPELKLPLEFEKFEIEIIRKKKWIEKPGS